MQLMMMRTMMCVQADKSSLFNYEFIPLPNWACTTECMRYNKAGEERYNEIG
jgi:hypothetical protein